MTDTASDQRFFSDVMKAVKASAATRRSAAGLLRGLSAADPHLLTKYEFSFKTGPGAASREVRFLNIDADAYSCRGRQFFLRRLALCGRLMGAAGRSGNGKRVLRALRRAADTPMDLYFGADIRGKSALFAFWLIFGGVKRDGRASFWPYDFQKLAGGLLKELGLREPPAPDREVLNFGLDIGEEITFKLYYLCREKVMKGSPFQALMEKLNDRLWFAKFFYFFSRMYDASGRLIKEKLFIEFLEDVPCRDGAKVGRVLAGLPVRGAAGAKRTLAACGGRISLISFEAGGTTTFYVRNR